MHTLADTATPHAPNTATATPASASTSLIPGDPQLPALTGRDLISVWRIARDTHGVPSPLALAGQHLDFADDNDWCAQNRPAAPHAVISYRAAADLHRLWAAIYGAAAAIRIRAAAHASQPLQAPVSGVPCGWCSDDDAWACVRVWDEHGDDPTDLEVCSRCASQLLDEAPETVRSEPMTEDDYARHGLPAGPALPTEWDTALAKLPTPAWDPADVLDWGQIGKDLDALIAANRVLARGQDEQFRAAQDERLRLAYEVVPALEDEDGAA